MSTSGLAFGQMRRSWRRLIPAGIAIAIATAFVAATVLVTTVVEQTARATVSERYSKAALVVSQEPFGEAGLPGPKALAAIENVPGVTSVSADSMWGAYVSPPSSDAPVAASQIVSTAVQAWSPTYPPSDAMTFTAGRSPQAAGQVALDERSAARLGLALGDTVHLNADGTTPYDATVSGVFTLKGDSSPLVLAAPQDLARPGRDNSFITYTRVYVATQDPDRVAQEIDALGLADIRVETAQEQSDQDLTNWLGSLYMILGFVYGFVAVALFVAGLVIANTFQVLIAARTRTLALLRCVGATRRQVRRLVITEALVLGAASSAVGLALGAVLTQLSLSLVAPSADVLLPRTISPSWLMFVAPLGLGLGVTLLAALLPARLATRVAPLEALRPQTAPRLAQHAGRVRLTGSVLLLLAGAALVTLGTGAALAGYHSETALAQLGIAILGSILLVVGLLLSAVFWLPRVVRWLGGLLGKPGSDARLAAVNAVRNPRRTAATSVALVIAVGLVAVMATGAQVARAGLTDKLEGTYPVDLAVTAIDPETSEVVVPAAERTVMSSDIIQQIGRLPGVADVLEVRAARVQGTMGGASRQLSVAGIDPAHLATLSFGTAVETLKAGKGLYLPQAPDAPSAPVKLYRPNSAAAPVTLSAEPQLRGLRLPVTDVIVPLADFERIAPSAPVVAVWLKLNDGADVSELRDQIAAIATGPGQTASGSQATIASPAVAFDVSGGFEMRTRYDSIIGTVLLVVLGLLAIAVVIALIGVANTLSLSIRERRRETALLRALGLTKRRVRRQLAIEGMLIAGVGALAGCLVGAVLGWAGAVTLLAPLGPPSFAIPWGWLGVLFVAAGACGAAASIVPGRSATRIAPTAALVTE